jgi:TAZ zinc finger
MATLPQHRDPRPLRPIVVGQRKGLTEAQRSKRQCFIESQASMAALLHASTCDDPTCPSVSCAKMKGLMEHGSQCQVKSPVGCHECKRIHALLLGHARRCKVANCLFPNCTAIRKSCRETAEKNLSMRLECNETNNCSARQARQLNPVAAGQENELTEEQRRERERSIELRMTLLLHASTCDDPKCPSANCAKMKGYLKHGSQCQVKSSGGCRECKRVWALLHIHARRCNATKCLVPNCMAIRERTQIHVLQCKEPNCLWPNCVAVRDRARQFEKQEKSMDDVVKGLSQMSL